MPRLKIDNREIEVPKGTKVIEVAERLGIIIPRFCYHAGLGSVGACRMCAVKFLEGPVKGIQMSCMVDAADGMVVSTTDDEAIDFRRHVIEWLMMNHPHDCPVCDEGGHCLLQDMTVAGGHGLRRYLGEKRTYRDQDLGPFVQHEMNRCIHCWRCRRFYQEFAGYRDLGALQIAYRTYFGRYKNGPLGSPFSGNLIDLCPTGVYTDKPSRFTGRRWDYVRGPSLCLHCSLGCHVVASVRYREVVRLEALFNGSVNGYFICDRGRYGFHYVNHHNRPRWARVETEGVPFPKALQAASDRLSEMKKKWGPPSIACLGSLRSSLETQAMLARLCEDQGFQGPACFPTSSAGRKVKRAASRLNADFAVSLREIERADFVLIVGADPLNEAPMLGLAIRQASRKGAAVTVIDPRPITLPFPFHHLPVSPVELNLCLGALIKKSIEPSVADRLGPGDLQFYEALPAGYALEGPLHERFAEAAKGLHESQHPILICGTDVVRETTPDFAADSVLFLRAAQKQARLFYVLPGANAFDASLFSSPVDSLEEILMGIEQGNIKGLLVVEQDLFYSFPERHRLHQAIDRLELLIVMDYLPSHTVARAHIFLPTLPLFETAGTFVNQEGRAQQAGPVHPGGLPVSQVSAGTHPPRSFRADIPGGESAAAWRVLSDLNKALSPSEQQSVSERANLWRWLAQQNPVFAPLTSFDGEPDGVRLLSEKAPEGLYRTGGGAPMEETVGFKKEMELLTVDLTFGTEELSGYSSHLHSVEEPPYLIMHPRDAGRLGLKAKDTVRLILGDGVVGATLCVAENMAPGVMVLPRHRQLEWLRLEGCPEGLQVEKI